MRCRNKNTAVVFSLLTLALPYVNLLATPVVNEQPENFAISSTNVHQDPLATSIDNRERARHGITIGEPKVYDDALLQRMLQQAEARLAAFQILDQRPITDKLGVVTGASQRISNFGLNAQGAPLPSVTTTSKGPTGSTQDVEQINAAGATTSDTRTITSNLATQDVVTTKAPFSPPATTVTTPSTTLPSSFSVSASDILNEQMQLTAEIQSLRLLLAGDLSGHFIRGGPRLGNSMTKLKTTLGFPITVIPDRRHKDAVAVIEVEVEKIQSLSNERPVITALLPREKTYNVASITDKSTSIGGGVATRILGVSGSWLRGQKIYYLVQDQDTLAFTFQPEARNRVGVMWEFRPVLGEQYVKPGLKQTFVQIAFPAPRDAADGEIGRISVRSYWRKYDSKNGICKEIISGTVRDQIINFDIPRFRLAVDPEVFNARDCLEDLGDGQMLVKLPGRFLPGTGVRIGSILLAAGDELRHDYSGLRFIAPIFELATKTVSIIAHDGTEIRLRFEQTLCSPRDQLQITEPPRITTVDEAHSRVRVRVNHPEWADGSPPLVFVIGERVFGYGDAPLRREEEHGVVYLSAIVPNALLLANPELAVQSLFPQRGCRASAKVEGIQLLSQTERLVVLEQGKSSVKYLLYGNRLRTAQILSPAGVTLQTIGTPPEDGDTLRLVELTEDQLKGHKHLLVQRSSERPFLVTLPALPQAETKKPEPPKARERVIVDANEAVIEGEGMKELEAITFRKKKVPFEIAEDGKSVRLAGLRALGLTATAATQTVDLSFKSGKATVRIEIVNAKVETIPK